MIDKDQVIYLCKRKGKLKAQRGTWETHWQDVANFVMPNESDFNLKRSKGDKRTTLLYDSTGVHAIEMLAAGLHGMLTNPASEWFSLRLKKDNDMLSDNLKVKNWLQETTVAILSELSAPDVAFPSHIHEYYLSLRFFVVQIYLMIRFFLLFQLKNSRSHSMYQVLFRRNYTNYLPFFLLKKALYKILRFYVLL